MDEYSTDEDEGSVIDLITDYIEKRNSSSQQSGSATPAHTNFLSQDRHVGTKTEVDNQEENDDVQQENDVQQEDHDLQQESTMQDEDTREGSFMDINNDFADQNTSRLSDLLGEQQPQNPFDHDTHGEIGGIDNFGGIDDQGLDVGGSVLSEEEGTQQDEGPRVQQDEGTQTQQYEGTQSDDMNENKHPPRTIKKKKKKKISYTFKGHVLTNPRPPSDKRLFFVKKPKSREGVSDFSIPKSIIYKVVRDICLDIFGNNKDIRFKANALDILHEVGEAYLVDLFKLSGLASFHRMTPGSLSYNNEDLISCSKPQSSVDNILTPKDMKLVRKIRDEVDE